MKAYEVSYYRTDCEGRVPTGATPMTEYYINKGKAEARAEEQRNAGWWIARVNVREIEINE